MATTRNTGRIIEPWGGTGWPLWIFMDSQGLLDKNIYFCSRDECGRVNQRITREPWQLHCGHRLCKECNDYIQSLLQDTIRHGLSDSLIFDSDPTTMESSSSCAVTSKPKKGRPKGSKNKLKRPVAAPISQSTDERTPTPETIPERQPSLPPSHDNLEFSSDDTCKMLQWWREEGKALMTRARNNKEKSAVWQSLTVHLENKPEGQRICDACQREPYDDDARGRRMETDLPSTDITPEGSLLSRNAGASGVSDPMDIDRLVSYDAVPTDVQFPSVAEDQGGEEAKSTKIERVMKDNAANRELNRLQVRCPYECANTTKLTIKTLEKHMNKCEERLVACEKCADVIKFSAKSEHATNSCPFRIVECPNKCGKRGLKGKDLPQHMAECEKKPPTCNICREPYKQGEESIHSHLVNCVTQGCPLGCGVSAEVKIVEHLNEQESLGNHLAKMMALLREAGDSLKTQAGGAGSAIPPPQLSSILERLMKLETKSANTEKILVDKVGQLTHEPADNLLENARLSEKNRSDLTDLDTLFKVLSMDVHTLTSYEKEFRTLAEKTSKKEAETTERMNKLETLSNIRIAEIEDQKVALNNMQMTSYNGNLIWRIDNVQRRRDEAQHRHGYTSHPFFTEVYGYRMCARLYFNGAESGKNTHISLYFILMKGEFDALLLWPFQQKVTLKLRNTKKKKPDVIESFRPDPRSSSFKRPVNQMNMGSGCHKFALQSNVFAPENGFVVDDTMFVEILVDNSADGLHGLSLSEQEVT